MATGKVPIGDCEIRGKNPHLWGLATVAMGFLVRQMRWEDQGFGNLLKADGIHGRTLPFRWYRKMHLCQVDVVFCDEATLGPPRKTGAKADGGPTGMTRNALIMFFIAQRELIYLLLTA